MIAINPKYNAIVYLASNVSVALVPFLLMPILTRYLGPVGYGTVAMFLVIINLFGAFVGLSVHGAITSRWFKSDDIDISIYISNCVFITLLTTFIVFGFVYISSNYLTEKMGIPIFWIYFAVIVSMANSLILIRLAIWQVEKKVLNYATLQILIALFGGVGSYLLVVKYLLNFEGRLWVHVYTYTFFAFASIISLKSKGYLKFNFRIDYIKDALRFGVPLVPHVLGGFLLVTAERIILNEMVGLKDLGVYMVAVQISLAMYMVADSFNKAFMPWLFEQLKAGSEMAKLKVVRVSYCFSLFLFCCVALSIVLSSWVIELIAGPEYSEASKVLPLLVLAQAFHGMYLLVTNYIFYERKTYYTGLITIFCGLSSIVTSYFLISHYGMLGAATGQVFGMFLFLVLTWVFANKVHPMPWGSKKVFSIG